jgi:hypothetical protein
VLHKACKDVLDVLRPSSLLPILIHSDGGAERNEQDSSHEPGSSRPDWAVSEGLHLHLQHLVDACSQVCSLQGPKKAWHQNGVLRNARAWYHLRQHVLTQHRPELRHNVVRIVALFQPQQRRCDNLVCEQSVRSLQRNPELCLADG